LGYDIGNIFEGGGKRGNLWSIYIGGSPVRLRVQQYHEIAGGKSDKGYRGERVLQRGIRGALAGGVSGGGNTG